MKLFITILLITTLWSCTTPTKRRGSLSDAFEAAEEPGGEVEGGGYYWDDPEDDDDYYKEPDNRDNEYSSSPDTSEFFGYFGIESDYQLIMFGDFSRAIGSNLTLGMNDDEIALFLKAGVVWLDTESRNHTYEKLNGGLLGVNAGLEFRKHLTSVKNLTYFDLVIDTNLSLMAWTYKNPISSMGDTITSDSITKFSLGAGPGVCIGKTLYLDSTVGFNLFSPYTSQGFDNDVFHPYLYFKFAAKLMFGS